MAKKKVESATHEPSDVLDILGKYVDPTNTQAVALVDGVLVINVTQVSKDDIDNLTAELGDRVIIKLTQSHPSECKD